MGTWPQKTTHREQSLSDSVGLIPLVFPLVLTQQCRAPKCIGWELLSRRDDGPPQPQQKLALPKCFIHCVQFGQTHNKYNFPTSLIFISYVFFRHIWICEQSGRFQPRQGCAGALEFLRRKPPETKTQSAPCVYAYGEKINSRHEAAWQADGTYLYRLSGSRHLKTTEYCTE